MAKPPFRAGTRLEGLGKEIFENICDPCYQDWIKMSVKLVNEMRLDTTDPGGQAIWLEQMKSFLGVGGSAADPWGRFLDKRVTVETRAGTKVVATLIGLAADSLNLAEFEGGMPEGFKPSTTGAKGSGTIARDSVLTLEPA